MQETGLLCHIQDGSGKVIVFSCIKTDLSFYWARSTFIASTTTGTSK